MTSVQIPVAYGGSNTPYTDGTDANGMAGSSGYGYKDKLFALFAELIAMANYLVTKATQALASETNATASSAAAAASAAGAANSAATATNKANDAAGYAALLANYVDISQPIRLHRKLVDADFAVPAGHNAMSAGPIEIKTGITVTVSDNSTWSIQ